MSKRREQPPFTLENVIKTAKREALKHSGHIPTLIAEDTKQAVFIQINDLQPTHEGRLMQLFTIGLVLALNSEIGVLQQAFFISEGWMSAGALGKQAQIPPSQDPQRKEVLLVARLDVATKKSELAVLEMIRNKSEQVVSLQDFHPTTETHEDDVTVENPLLLAFVRGFLQGRTGNVH